MNIPNNEMHYTVRYKITGFEGEKETLAYPSYDVAEEHRLDIQSYEGVYDVYLVPVQSEIK